MRFRTKSGQTLGYLPSGSGALTLVLLHPIGLRAQLWGDLAAELSAEYRILAVDAPGHGESDVPAEPLSIGAMAALVGELAEALGGDRIVPVGCSMGSAMAGSLATILPKERVAALVLSNSSYQPLGVRNSAHLQRAEAARLGMPHILAATLDRWFETDTSPELIARTTDWLLNGDPMVHAWCWHALGDFSYEPLLPWLTMPTLAIGGERDKAAKPIATRALAAAVADGTYAEIAGAGHLSPLEQPAAFAAAIRAFLTTRSDDVSPAAHLEKD